MNIAIWVAITWTNFDPDPFRHLVSLGHNENWAIADEKKTNKSNRRQAIACTRNEKLWRIASLHRNEFKFLR